MNAALDGVETLAKYLLAQHAMFVNPFCFSSFSMELAYRLVFAERRARLGGVGLIAVFVLLLLVASMECARNPENASAPVVGNYFPIYRCNN